MMIIDARGDACPLPVIKTKKALADMEAGGKLQVLVDNEIAVQNIGRFLDAAGHAHQVEQQDGVYTLTITVGRGAPSAAEDAVCGKSVVVLSSDCMGSGDEVLGRLLMKGFVFALTQLDTLPDVILLYNSGAKLSISGANTLADLKSLETAGVRILTCGTCLEHFGIAELLSVGDVTNMYTIAEEMCSAGRVVRP